MTPAQRAAFERDGYLVVRGLLPRAYLEQVRDEALVRGAAIRDFALFDFARRRTLIATLARRSRSTSTPGATQFTARRRTRGGRGTSSAKPAGWASGRFRRRCCGWLTVTASAQVGVVVESAMAGAAAASQRGACTACLTLWISLCRGRGARTGRRSGRCGREARRGCLHGAAGDHGLRCRSGIRWPQAQPPRLGAAHFVIRWRWRDSDRAGLSAVGGVLHGARALRDVLRGRTRDTAVPVLRVRVQLRAASHRGSRNAARVAAKSPRAPPYTSPSR